MYTQCQHCLTMFRITSEQLMAADGKVRCCQCNNVFNALQNLVESPASFINDSDLQEGLAEADQNEIAAISASQLLHEESTSDGLTIESNLVSDSEIEKSLDALADEQPPIQQLGEESILEVDESSSEPVSQSQFLLERDDGLETEPDYYAAGTESQMSELLDQDSTSLLLEEKGDDEQLADVISLDKHDRESHAEAETISSGEEPFPEEKPAPLDKEPYPEEKPAVPEEGPFPEGESITTDEMTPTAKEQSIISDEYLEQEPATGFLSTGRASPAYKKTIQPLDSLDDETRFTFEEEYEKPQPSRYRGYWALASLLLLLPLSAQIAWYLRDNLVTHYAGRQILQGVCNLAGCEVPIRRDTELIVISHRALTAHPEKKGVLSLKLEMVNTATYQQPFPKLLLSLFDDMGKIIARRTFLPNEYMDNQYQSDQMMPELKTVHVELELQDPGNEVTGFKFDFL